MDNQNKLDSMINRIRNGELTPDNRKLSIFLAMTELDNPIVPGTKMLDTVIIYAN